MTFQMILGNQFTSLQTHLFYTLVEARSASLGLFRTVVNVTAVAEGTQISELELDDL